MSTKMQLAYLFNHVTSELYPYLTGMYANGYCADATLEFDGSEHLSALMAALPPEPCVMIVPDDAMEERFTVKPTHFLRDTDGTSVDLFPVTLAFPREADEGKAIWWTLVKDKTVAVSLSGFPRRHDMHPVEVITGSAASKSCTIAHGKGSTVAWALS